MARKCPFGAVLWAWHWKGWTDAELIFTFRFFRPPDIVVGGLIFYRDSSSSSSSSSFFFFRPLISELAERNSSKIGHMLGSNCDLKTHVQNLGVSSPPTNRGPKNHLFGPTSQLNFNCNGLYLRNETRHRQSYIKLQLSKTQYPGLHDLCGYVWACFKRGRMVCSGVAPHTSAEWLYFGTAQAQTEPMAYMAIGRAERKKQLQTAVYSQQ